jgi:hypothetical protein
VQRCDVSGHVFHPGHDALHGITVVLETTGTRTYVGRFDSQDATGVHLLDVGVHDRADPAVSKDDFLRRTLKFGVRVDRKHLIVPPGEVAKVVPLSAING